jgi:hypothetical protein
MGWASASEIFDPVCKELQKSFLVPETRQKILVVLIKALQDSDWDTEDESLNEFSDDPAVVKAFGECGIYLWGTPEYDHAYGENSVEAKHPQGDEYNSDLGF